MQRDPSRIRITTDSPARMSLVRGFAGAGNDGVSLRQASGGEERPLGAGLTKAIMAECRVEAGLCGTIRVPRMDRRQSPTGTRSLSRCAGTRRRGTSGESRCR
jgi:hypothetical protein